LNAVCPLVASKETAVNDQSAIAKIGGVEIQRSIGAIERRLREELAAAFRVGFYLGWNIDTLNHITLRITDTNTFLMNPSGLAWSEITAASLATVTYDGEVLSHAGVRLAPAGFNFHSGILKARPEINCVMHTHAAAGTVISALQEPLLIFDQSGCLLYEEVGYHDFEGLADQPDEVPRILSDLGQNHTLIMRNHGLLTIGSSVGEAFGWMRLLVDACALQERVLATGRRFRVVPEDVQRSTKAHLSGTGNEPQEDFSWQYFLRLAKDLEKSA
jgi:ribulose-5-phosphate 4-epimerase/fuculose-1-phosphate aldolase